LKSQKRLIDIAHHLGDGGVVYTDDDAIRLDEIVKRGAFFQELRIVRDMERRRTGALADAALHLVTRSDRDGGFHNDNARKLRRSIRRDGVSDLIGARPD